MSTIRDSGDLTMAQVAEKAGVSRQAVYLHFPGREILLDALRAESPAAPDLHAAPSARAALGLLIAAQSNADPVLAALAEPPADAQARLEQCRQVATRFRDEGALAPQLSVEAGAALLWTLTSPAVWRDLTGLGWGPERYRSHVTFLAVGALTK
jgi:AcrR family transcriptional regulator